MTDCSAKLQNNMCVTNHPTLQNKPTSVTVKIVYLERALSLKLLQYLHNLGRNFKLQFIHVLQLNDQLTQPLQCKLEYIV